MNVYKLIFILVPVVSFSPSKQALKWSGCANKCSISLSLRNNGLNNGYESVRQPCIISLAHNEAREIIISTLRYIIDNGTEPEKPLSKALRNNSHVDENNRRFIAEEVLGTSSQLRRLKYVLDSHTFCKAHSSDPCFLLELRNIEKQLQNNMDLSALFVSDSDFQHIKDALSSNVWPIIEYHSLAVQWSLPDWFTRCMIAELGLNLASIVAEACSYRGPVSLRANKLKTSPSRLTQNLISEHNIATVHSESYLTRSGVSLVLGRPYGGIWSLEPFKRGEFEVQDLGSQHIIYSCEAKEGEVILDFCAGNGGKSLGLAADVGIHGKVFCWDTDSKRLKQLSGRADRAGASDIVNIVTSLVDIEQQGILFDVVLVDAPCSSTGVIRRRVGLREELGYSDAEHTALVKLPMLQRSILMSASKFVKPGGRLIYATCSILAAENEKVALWFDQVGGKSLFSNWDFVKSDGFKYILTNGNRQQLLPSKDILERNTDGFFICRWMRNLT